jgi:hypothetical protein
MRAQMRLNTERSVTEMRRSRLARARAAAAMAKMRKAFIRVFLLSRFSSHIDMPGLDFFAPCVLGYDVGAEGA